VINTQDNCSFAMVDLAPLGNAGSGASLGSLAHVPFDFVVGVTVLPAGPYAVEPARMGGMFSVRRADCDSETVLVHAIHGGKRKPTAAPNKLLFYCQENSYFLAQALAG
jgi:hypothetical protein